MKNRKNCAALALLMLAGCSTIIEGHSQEIAVNTSPEGASCKLARKGETIATIEQTPSSVYIEKTKDDITITCTKKGYEEATYLNHSGVDGVTVGNVVLGGLIGWGVDSATGSDNKYDSPVNISLSRR